MKIMLAAAAALLVASAASAAVTTTDYSFSAPFDSGPYATLGGTFSLAADDVAGTLDLTALNFSIGSTVYDLTNTSAFLPGQDFIGIGANLNAPGAIVAYTNDFYFIFRSPSLSSASLIYATAQGDWGFGIDSIRLTSSTTPAVPEPASWALMLAGFGAIGGTMRWRKREVHAAVAS